MKILFLLSLMILTESQAQEVSFRKRYINHTEFGGLFGRVKYVNSYDYKKSTVDSKASLTMQTFNGMQLNQRLGVGITVGMDWYKTALINPVAAGIRYDLTQRNNVRLFALADAGYGFGWLHQDSDGYKTKGGWMINPGVGLKIGKINSAAFTLSLTYKRQVAYADKPLFNNMIVRYEDRVYNRLAARIGISF